MLLTIEINDTVMLILAVIGAIRAATLLANLCFKLDAPVHH